jgi:hypothetical protein
MSSFFKWIFFSQSEYARRAKLTAYYEVSGALAKVQRWWRAEHSVHEQSKKTTKS